MITLLLLLLSFVLTVFYVSIMHTYQRVWKELEESTECSDTVSTFISVIIPARNEAKNILNVLADIERQSYPLDLMEVIVIDDNSEDNTYELCLQFKERKTISLQVYKLNELIDAAHTSVYKKRAIEAAVHQAKGTLIVTTDADCSLQNHWLRSIATLYEKEKPALIAAPVAFQNDVTAFEKFQALDFCGMQAITGASLTMEMFNMANGANLAYEKKAFLAVEGYQHIDQKASGDDMLLVYKIAHKFSNNIRFLKNKYAIVFTTPQRTLAEFLQQRFRWTSKSRSYQDRRITMILGVVYLFVLSIWMNLFYFILKAGYSILFPEKTLIAFIHFLPALLFLVMSIFQVICKTLVDYFFLRSSVVFFNRSDLMHSFVISELYHIWYIPFVGTFGNILKYKWKGRTLS